MLMCIVFCLVPARPHYWTRLIRFGPRGPSEFLSLSAVRLGYVLDHRNALTEKAYKDILRGQGNRKLC